MAAMTDLAAALERVGDQHGFAAFIDVLRRDITIAARDPDDRAATQLDPLLAGMARWAASPVAKAAVDGTNPWQAAARLLVAGYVGPDN